MDRMALDFVALTLARAERPTAVAAPATAVAAVAWIRCLRFSDGVRLGMVVRSPLINGKKSWSPGPTAAVPIWNCA
jgi:hypothetical protein